MSTPSSNDPRSRTAPGTYRVYGITLSSDFPFQTPLAPAHGDPDLTFTRVWEPPSVPEWWESEPLFESRYRLDDGEPQVRLYRSADFQVFRQAGVADYYIWPDRIICHQQDEDATNVVELYFLSLLTGFWLESRGVVVLHASAVSIEDRAAVFLATNTGGKTSLATSLMLAGHPLITDDFLAISVSDETAVGYPSFPQMRMWPDLVDHFLGQAADLPHVLPGTNKRRVPVGQDGIGDYCRTERPLARLYLPSREPAGESGMRIEATAPAQGLIELVRESFLTAVLERAGLHRERFHRLATLARRVPMARLVYPTGLERLPEVREAILADMGRDR